MIIYQAFSSKISPPITKLRQSCQYLTVVVDHEMAGHVLAGKAIVAVEKTLHAKWHDKMEIV